MESKIKKKKEGYIILIELNSGIWHVWFKILSSTNNQTC